MTPLVEREIRVFGAKRSGHNAISTWIAGHFPKNEVYHMWNTHFTFRKRFKGDGFRTDIENNGVWFRNLINVAQNYELPYYTHDLMRYNGEAMSLVKQYKFCQFTRRLFVVFIIRSANNNLASVLEKCKKGRNWGWNDAGESPHDVFIKFWPMYVREALGETCYVPEEKEEYHKVLPKKVPIYFDAWFSSKKYRKHISKMLGLGFSDKYLQEVPTATGSSFDEFMYRGRAQQMKVLERYKLYEDDLQFNQTLNHPEIARLSEKLEKRYEKFVSS